MIRLVKLEFNDRNINDFKIIFENIKHRILQSDGCHGLKLLQDAQKPNIFFTYSLWENEASLNNYRNSELFDSNWSIIKQWFSAKPQAWTMNSLDELQ